MQPAIDVIRSATTVAARLVGMAGRIGEITPGAFADLVVVDGEPLSDLSVLTRPKMVVKAGQPVSWA